MERVYRIVSIQSASEPGRAIYCLLRTGNMSFRILAERRETWKVDDVIQLEDAFVLEHREAADA